MTTPSPFTTIEAFFDSPSNRTGLLVLVSDVVATIAEQASTHTISWWAVASVALYGFLKIVQPDNTVTQAQLMKAGLDVQAAIKSPGTIAVVLQDGASIASGLAPNVPVATTTPALTPKG